ncbi:hypothetical protein NMG60_11031521 [Bertholletia excelsa]
MAKFHVSKHAVCLVCSLLLNLYFALNLHVGDKLKQLTWSQGAAAEAEAVAAVSCSGHGRAYLDGLLVDGKPICECNSGFRGPDCSQFSPETAADGDSGDPLFLEPFWIQNAASSALLVAGWHRMSYTFDDKSFISHELEKHIRKVHSKAKNAVTEGRYMVFGAGSTQLLNAAVSALSPENASSPARVVASIPYYPLYQQQTDFFRSVKYEFQGDAALWKNTTVDSAIVIEFVTSPNNPDGQLKRAILKGSDVKTVHDRAYYWPHFTAIPTPANDDLMIFTISKLTGHAGSRFGWALVKDEAVYQRMTQYMTLSEMGVSRDAQLRALKLLKVVLEGDGRHIFNFAYPAMRKRWERLSQTISLSKRFTLQAIPPQFCTFFQQVRGPSPAYAWLKCKREEEKNCTAVLRAANIIGRPGSKFAAGDRYVRLSLVKGQDDFELLLSRLHDLVTEEDGTKTM